MDIAVLLIIGGPLASFLAGYMVANRADEKAMQRASVALAEAQQVLMEQRDIILDQQKVIQRQREVTQAMLAQR